MEKTLYDILEVSPSATHDAIRANYSRLSAQLDEQPYTADEKVLRRSALSEAFLILDSPARRATYDRRLQARPAPAEPFWTWSKAGGIAILAVVLGGYAHKQQSELARIELQKEFALGKAREAEKARAEAEARAAAAWQAYSRARAAAYDANYALQRAADLAAFKAEQERAARSTRNERLADQTPGTSPRL